MEFLFILGRVLLGTYFIKSGANHFMHLASMTGYAQSKGVPMAREAVILSGIMMILGGFGILLGAQIGLSILLLVIFLVSTLVKMHTYWNITDPMARMGEEVNFNKNLALIGALLMLLFIPTPWFISLM